MSGLLFPCNLGACSSPCSLVSACAPESRESLLLSSHLLEWQPPLYPSALPKVRGCAWPISVGRGLCFLGPLTSSALWQDWEKSGFVLLWWKHFFFFFAAFCMWSRSKKLLDSDWEEGDSVLNSVIYDLWSLLSHCFLSCKVGIIIKVVIIIAVDLSVQWKAIWRITVKTHGKALINQKLL